MGKKSTEYWKKRFEQIENTSHSYGEQTFQKVAPAFDKAQRQIQKEIDSWYVRYAKNNNNISMLEAKRQLNTRELKELRWDVKDYIKYGEENALDSSWMKELENASARYHISRLDALKLRTQQALEVAYGNENDEVDSMTRQIYTDGYYMTMFEVQKGFNIGWDVGTIDQKKLDTLISRPWAADGKTFSQRIWQGKTTMVNELHNELIRTCILGKAPDEAIKNMTKFVDGKVKNAKAAASRLVMTEQAYFSSASQKTAYNDLDVEKYEIVATLDSRTSNICQGLDGEVFEMKDYQPGVTANPFHPFVVPLLFHTLVII